MKPNRNSGGAFALPLALGLLAGPSVPAQAAGADELKALREEVAQMRRAYEGRIAALHVANQVECHGAEFSTRLCSAWTFS